MTMNTPMNMDVPTTGSDQILLQYNELVAECQAHICEIQAKTAEVQRKTAEYFQSDPDTGNSEFVFGEIESIMNSVNSNAGKCKSKLQLMSYGTSKLKVTPVEEASNSAVIRIQQNQYANLVRSFTQAMMDYEDVQDQNMRFYEEQAARQIMIKCVTADGSAIDEAEAMRLVREDIWSLDSIFTCQPESLASIISTRDDMFWVNVSMRELNQLFSDLAELVADQGEIMDQVLHNVQQAPQYVNEENLNRQIIPLPPKSRKKLCWIIALLVVVVLLVVIPVVLGVTASG